MGGVQSRVPPRPCRPTPPSGIDPAELGRHSSARGDGRLDEAHPDFVAVRHATAKMFKAVKKVRRREIRDAIAEADRAVVAATATGAPDRIDDETRGIPISTATTAPTAGTLLKARACYICKQPYTVVDAFYHQLCPDCAAMSHAKRDARTDLTGKRALLTGGRAKIGMYIALRLLRDGAHTTITTRFPRDAVRRFSSLPDSAEWIDRLKVVGIDLRDPAQVIGLADDVAAAGPPRHPDQQRDPDRAPLARRVPAARRCRARSAARRAAARARHLRAHQRPAPAGARALGDAPTRSSPRPPRAPTS